jgi:hypothetical protein
LDAGTEGVEDFDGGLPGDAGVAARKRNGKVSLSCREAEKRERRCWSGQWKMRETTYVTDCP